MSELASYLEETGLVYVLYRLKEDFALMEEEGKTLLGNIPLNEEYAQRLFFGEGEEGIYTKTTLPVPLTDGSTYTQVIDIAVLSHLAIKEKALAVFDQEMNVAARRREEFMKAALSFKPLVQIHELHGACISGSLAQGRHPSPWCDIDILIFTERDLRYVFYREWRRKPLVKEFIWTEFDYDAVEVGKGYVPSRKESIFKKEGTFAINVIVVQPSTWIPLLKKMPFGKRQHYLEILEDCYPLVGETYIKNLYLSVKD